MKERMLKWMEPKMVIPESRKLFSDKDLKNLIMPLFMEQLLAVLVGVADTFMVSYAGEAAVSGVSLVNMFNTIFIYLFSALAAGGAVVVSQYIGSKNEENGNLSSGQLMTASVVFSLCITAFVLAFSRPLLRALFGAVEAEVMEACVTYLRISAYSYPALAVYNAGAAMHRSMGKTRVTMYLSAVSNGINVAGNAIGIFVLHAGVAGVAYPSLAARVFSAAVIAWMCFDRKNAVWLERKHILRWDRGMVRRILGIAVPNGIESGLFQLAKVGLSSITALFGTVQIAANGVAQSFWSVAALMGTAMGLAFVTVIGQCMGAGDREAAEYYMRKLLRLTFGASVLWNGFIFAVSPLVLKGFALSEEGIRLVLVLIAIHNLFNAVCHPFSNALPNGLRAAGDVRFTMYFSLLPTAVGRVVFSVIFGIWMKLGVIGVALAMCLDWVLRAVIFWRRFDGGKWKEFRVI